MPIHGLAPSLMPPQPAHFDIEKVIRPNILALHPYRCARDDYQSGILLDANENALGHAIAGSPSKTPNGMSNGTEHEAGPNPMTLDLHRYPDPSHPEIKERISALRGLPGTEHVFLGVGSDECIDLLMRVCVTPGGSEKILVTPPTYGMYAVTAQVNDIPLVKVPLELSGEHGEGGEKGRFSVKVEEVKKAVDADPSIKLIFLCSPGNPTGTLISIAAIRSLLEYERFKGIVVVDEAYIDFSGAESSAVSLISEYANLCVMQTLSKSFGLAAIRLGIALAQPPLIQVLSNTKAPYNISAPSAQLAHSALSNASLSLMRDKVSTLKRLRGELLSQLATEEMLKLGVGAVIGNNNANFVLVPILSPVTGKADNARAQKLYKSLAEEQGVVVRYRGSELGCEGCLRVTVGTEGEVRMLLEKMKNVLSTM